MGRGVIHENIARPGISRSKSGRGGVHFLGSPFKKQSSRRRAARKAWAEKVKARSGSGNRIVGDVVGEDPTDIKL